MCYKVISSTTAIPHICVSHHKLLTLTSLRPSYLCIGSEIKVTHSPTSLLQRFFLFGHRIMGHRSRKRKRHGAIVKTGDTTTQPRAGSPADLQSAELTEETETLSPEPKVATIFMRFDT